MEYGSGATNHLVWRTVENRYHNEKFQVDEENINVNVAMLGKLVRDDDNILDIGCGEGKLGAVLYRKKCRLIGVDIDSAACKQAQETGNYSQVYQFDIESPERYKEGERYFRNLSERFDKIAIIDVLEHVINPTNLICNSVQYLKEGGKILISIPNVNNADILLNLLRGKFNYQESGVLDNTHTKYFTRRSFIEWIQEMNEVYDFSLDCEYVGSTFGYTEYLEKVKKEMPDLFQFIQLNPYFHAIQHLFVLTYSQQKNNDKIKNLKKLLKESEPDLAKILDQLLNKKNSENSEGFDIKLLPNERKILEEKAESAENGWKSCALELKKARQYEIKIENDIRKLKDVLEQQAAEKDSIVLKWKECSEALESLKRENAERVGQLRQIDKTENGMDAKTESVKLLEKWRECSEALENARQKIADQSDELKSADTFAKKLLADISVKDAEIERLEKENLHILKKWKECAAALDELRK